MGNEIVLIGFYILTLVYSVIIHEVSHGVVALWLGDLTAKYADRLNLNPLKHIDPFGSVILPLLLAGPSQYPTIPTISGTRNGARRWSRWLDLPRI